MKGLQLCTLCESTAYASILADIIHTIRNRDEVVSQILMNPVQKSLER